MGKPYIPFYVVQKWTPGGKFVGVTAMTFGKGRINVGDELFIYDCWCYETLDAAIAAFEKWDADKDPEPEGWFRNPTTGRRRPDNDPLKEYVHL